MRAVIQRVSSAQVDIDGETVGSIGHGLLILLGVGHGDGEEQAERLWSKIARLRIFEDDDGKTNLSLADVGGEVLVRRARPTRRGPRGNGPLRRVHGRVPGERRPLHALARHRRALMRTSPSCIAEPRARKLVGRGKPSFVVEIEGYSSSLGQAPRTHRRRTSFELGKRSLSPSERDTGASRAAVDDE